MHDVRVVLAGKNISGAPHVCCELVNLVEWPIEDLFYKIFIAQVADDKFIRRARREFWLFEIRPAHPISFGLEPLRHMGADEPSRAANQCCFLGHSPLRILSFYKMKRAGYN